MGWVFHDGDTTCSEYRCISLWIYFIAGISCQNSRMNVRWTVWYTCRISRLRNTRSNTSPSYCLTLSPTRPNTRTPSQLGRRPSTVWGGAAHRWPRDASHHGRHGLGCAIMPRHIVMAGRDLLRCHPCSLGGHQARCRFLPHHMYNTCMIHVGTPCRATVTSPLPGVDPLPHHYGITQNWKALPSQCYHSVEYALIVLSQCPHQAFTVLSR